MSTLIISPKDTTDKIELTNVRSFCQEGRTLLVVFESDETRNYPLEHIWYYATNVLTDTIKMPAPSALKWAQ